MHPIKATAPTMYKVQCILSLLSSALALFESWTVDKMGSALSSRGPKNEPNSEAHY